MLQDHSPVERRIAARIDVERAIAIETDTGTLEARTVNVSTSGMLVVLDGALTIWAEVSLELAGTGLRIARVVRHDGERYGLVFREPLSPAEFSAFTGIEIAAEEPDEAEPVVRSKRVGRIAPQAFGRDRLKTLKREAAERAGPRAR